MPPLLFLSWIQIPGFFKNFSDVILLYVLTSNNHASDSYPQSTCCSPPGVYETQVTLSDEILDEPAADGTTVQESRSTGVLKPNLRSGTAENLTCPGCGKSFRKPMMLRHHQKSEHPTTEQVYQCDKCDKTFQTKRRLEQHHQAHATVKPYTCSYCGKGLPCPKVLKTHMRVHTGERRYGCKICGKKFDQASTLTHHMRLHKGDKPFLCSECGKAFPSSSAFLIHTRMHTGERPYQCKECGKRYVTLHRLKVHQGLHTLERPYTCDQCGKSFRYPSEFGRHKVIHAGEKTFKCVICDKRFSLAGNLKSHMQIHAKMRAAKKSSQWCFRCCVLCLHPVSYIIRVMFVKGLIFRLCAASPQSHHLKICRPKTLQRFVLLTSHWLDTGIVHREANYTQ